MLGKSTEEELLVPEARLELAQARGPGDFESPASTHSTTPAVAHIVTGSFTGWQALFLAGEAEGVGKRAGGL